MKRVLIIGGLVLVIVLTILIYSVFMSLDMIVEAAIETYGSEVTQTSVTVEEVRINVTDGQGIVKGLRVGNPRGFTTDHAFRLGEIHLVLDVGTITKDPVIVKEIRIVKPAVTYELWLRLHVLGLGWAGSPYAFHSIGSTLAIDARARPPRMLIAPRSTARRRSSWGSAPGSPPVRELRAPPPKPPEAPG